MQNLYIIVIKKNTNYMLPAWTVGSPVNRRDDCCYVKHSFDLADSCFDCYSSKQEAQAEIDLREDSFVGIEFEVLTYKLIK